MRVLKAIKLYNISGFSSTRKNIVRLVWGKTLGKDVTPNWQNGPFTLLKNHGFAKWERNGNGRVLWFITGKGKKFLAKCEAR